MNDYPKPKWWRLYAILPFACGLLALESQLSVPRWEHETAQFIIVVFVFVLIAWWLKANAAALSREEADDHQLRVTTFSPRTQRRQHGMWADLESQSEPMERWSLDPAQARRFDVSDGRNS